MGVVACRAYRMPNETKLMSNEAADSKQAPSPGDGQPVKSTADVRYFYTPTLESGQTYFYDLRIETEKDGKKVVQEKQVFVKAGDVVRESFKSDQPAAGAAKK